MSSNQLWIPRKEKRCILPDYVKWDSSEILRNTCSTLQNYIHDEARSKSTWRQGNDMFVACMTYKPNASNNPFPHPILHQLTSYNYDLWCSFLVGIYRPILEQCSFILTEQWCLNQPQEFPRAADDELLTRKADFRYHMRVLDNVIAISWWLPCGCDYSLNPKCVFFVPPLPVHLNAEQSIFPQMMLMSRIVSGINTGVELFHVGKPSYIDLHWPGPRSYGVAYVFLCWWATEFQLSTRPLFFMMWVILSSKRWFSWSMASCLSSSFCPWKGTSGMRWADWGGSHFVLTWTFFSLTTMWACCLGGVLSTPCLMDIIWNGHKFFLSFAELVAARSAFLPISTHHRP